MGDLGYPYAERLDLVDDLHGRLVADPYRWLEDPEDPRTVKWSAAQDALLAERVAELPGRAALTTTLEPMLRAGSVGAPVWRAGRAFFTRHAPDHEHEVLYVREPDGSERALVDPNQLDPSGLTVLDGWSPSREGTRLAYLTSVGGDEESRLTVLDVATGELLEGPIDRVKFTPIGWLPGGEELIYVRRLPPHAVPEGESLFHRRVWRHKVGADPDQTDELLHGDGLAATMLYGLDLSSDGRWLVITGALGTARRTWLWLADLHSGEGPRQLLDGTDDVRADAWVESDGRLYVHTTLGADRWRLCVTDPTTPEKEHWRELIPEDPGAVLEAVRYVRGARRLVTLYARHACAEAHLYDAETGAHVAQVPLPGLGTVVGLTTVDGATPHRTDTVWLGWTDFVTPPCVYRYEAGVLTLDSAAPGAVPPPPLESRQVTYASKDGTPIRMFILTPEGPSDGPHQPRPTMLTGYGGFAIIRRPEYSPQALGWVASGGVYALAGLRGGAEEGEVWHRAGMRELKQNVYDDFHAAAEHLIAEGHTTSAQLAITGGSNGGLLVGAALTQRPDLYRAVVCAKPLLDMVRYERFLIGRFWNHEYGSADVPEELDWLLAYSPYHRVVEGTDYPAVLLTSYESDARTDPCHARKMAAALQYATSGDPANRPILLRREVGVGHGARAVSKALALSVDMLSFLGHHTGL